MEITEADVTLDSRQWSIFTSVPVQSILKHLEQLGW